MIAVVGLFNFYLLNVSYL